MTAGAVLDVGVFIRLERRDAVMADLVRRFDEHQTPLVTSAAVVAQVWRGGSGAQVPIAHLLRRTEVADLTYGVATVLGRMLGASATHDPVDAHIALLARQRGWVVLTSDPDDLRRIDPKLRVQVV